MDNKNNQKLIDDFQKWLVSNKKIGNEIQDSQVESIINDYINFRGKQFIENHFGDLNQLKSGNIYGLLRNELVNYGLKPNEKKIAKNQDVLERYKNVPLHLMFLYTSEDNIVHEYIIKNWDALDSLSSAYCDIHPMVDQFKNFENGYDIIDQVDIIQKSGFNEISKLPGLFFWDNKNNSEFISFGESFNSETIRNTIRFIFEKIRNNQSIDAISKAKAELEKSVVVLRRDSFVFEKVIVTLASLIILILVAFLVIRNEKFAEPEFSTWIRILLSLSVSTLGATLPGYLKLNWSGKGLIIRAGGAIALFVLTYLFSPSIF